MFKRLLIANRGQIAARVVRACREMGIASVALYEPADQGSLHVRLADEAAPLPSEEGFLDWPAILKIAEASGADALHPGYGFLAERANFIRDCERRGITFVGPPAGVVEGVQDKLATLERARAAGIRTVAFYPRSFAPDEFAELRQAAEEIGYPLVVKTCRGGRGIGERLVSQAERLQEAVLQAQAESRAVYGNQCVYLEKAIPEALPVAVQLLGDSQGRLLHLGEREGTLVHRHRKIVEESPGVRLSEAQRSALRESALEIGRLFGCQNAMSVEFLIDARGEAHFAEIKARITVDHPLTEVMTRVDLIREQIRLAAGAPLALAQEDVPLQGWAMLCRVIAVDPLHHHLPTAGEVQRLHLPGGPEVRVDTYLYDGAMVPAQYDPLLAVVCAWDQDRASCLARMRRVVEAFKIGGVGSNLPLLQRFLKMDTFAAGGYDGSLPVAVVEAGDGPEELLRDLAAVAAILHVRRGQLFHPETPPRIVSGWHRDSRRLPG